MQQPRLTPDLLLRAYAAGVFPMAADRDDPEIHWIDPRHRGIFPIGGFHMSRSLARAMLRTSWQVRVDTDFEGVLTGCADRPETWINKRIHKLYADLHRMGHAHSLEIWEGEVLVGGVYGVTLGAAFFGESMFSRRRDASKMALAWLHDRLQVGGFRLFDTQFLTPHLASLGAREISRSAYHTALTQALRQTADFNRQGEVPSASEVIQRNTQRS